MAADGTIRGTFDLNVPAQRKLRDLRKEAALTDKSMMKLGRTMDRIGGRAAEQRVNRYSRTVRDMGRQSERTFRQVDKGWRQSTREVERSTTKQRMYVNELRREVQHLGRTKATARVDVDGLAEALAEIRVLKRELNSLGRRHATAGIGFSGGGGGGGRGFGGGGSRIMGMSTRALAGGAAAALPAVRALTGATVALSGSLAGAGLGAGAIGLAGGGALAVGIGSIAAIALPAKKRIKDAADAQKKYNEAIAKFGRDSKQAKAAKDAMDRAFDKAPKGTRQMLKDVRELGREWAKLTKPGQDSIINFLGGGVARARRFAPTFSRAANRSAAAVGREGGSLSRFLTGRRSGRFVTDASGMFNENLGNARRMAQFSIETFQNITRASRPFLKESTNWLAEWTRGWARGTRDIESTRDKIGQMVGHLKAWKRLGGSTFRLLKDLMKFGAPSGKTFVERLTNQLDRWDQWINRNPTKVRSFFKRTVNSTIEMGKALYQITKALSSLAKALTPVLDRFSQLIDLLGRLNLLTPGLGALGLGFFRGVRGRGGGAGGGGGGGAAGGLAAGMAAQGLMSRGGGAARGAVAAGGGMRAAAGGIAGALSLRGTRGALGYLRPGRGLERAALATAVRGRGIAGAGGAARALGMGVRGASKAFWPIAAITAGLDAASFEGSPLDRGRYALNRATFGLTKPLIGTPLSKDEKMQNVDERLNKRFGNLSDPAVATGRQQLADIQSLKFAYRTAGDNLIGTGAGEDEIGYAKKQLKEELNLRLDAYREYKKQRDAVLNEKSRQTGGIKSNDITEAFNIRSGKQGPAIAMRKTVNETLQTMRRMRPAGAKILGENMIVWARQQAKGNPKLLAQVKVLETRIKKSFSRTGQHVQIVNGRILTGSKSEWKRISNAIGTEADRARQEGTSAFTQLQKVAVGSLVAMGFSRSDARGLVAGMDADASKSRNKAAAVGIESGPGSYNAGIGSGRLSGPQSPKRARGGRLPGRGLRDTVRMSDGGFGAPGELVVNRHTENRVNKRLMRFGTTLGREVSMETQPHAMPMKREVGLARGGRVGGGGGALGGLQPGVAAATRAILGRFPLTVTSTTGGGHAANSYHYKGMAVDLGGSAETMRAAAAWIKSSSLAGKLTEGIHNPNLSIKGGSTVPPSFWGGSVWANHGNHIHIALGGKIGAIKGGAGALAGGMAAQMPALRARPSRAGGALGAASNRARSLMAAGLTKKINRSLAARGATAGGGDLSGFSGGGGPAANMALGRRMLLAAGFGPDQWPALKELWTGESGWNNKARNASSGAFGIPQSLPASKMGPKAVAGDPAAQIRWGLNYIKGRYGTPSNALAQWRARSPHWYEKGGRIDWAGWHRRGGQFTTRPGRAAIFGAGEGSAKEDVVIKPHRPRRRGARTNAGGSGGITVNVHIGSLNTGAGDPKEMMDELGQKIAVKILDALDSVDSVSDEVLTG